MSHPWPMSGYDAGNTHYHPRGAGLKGEPEKLKSVNYHQVTPDDAPGVSVPPSSPVAVDNILYFMFKGDLIAYDYTTETERWRLEHNQDESSCPDRFTGSPSLADGEVIASDRKFIYFVERSSGEVTDRCRLDSLSGYVYESIECPVVTDKYIYYNNGGLILAIDPTTREIDWRFSHEEINGRPLIENNSLLVQGTKSLYCVDSNEGLVHWKRDLETTSGKLSPRAVRNNILIAVTDEEIVGLDTNTGTIEWRYTVSSEFGSRNCYSDNWARVSIGTNKVFAVITKQKAGEEPADEYLLCSVSLSDGTEQWSRTCTISFPVTDRLDSTSVGRPLIAGNTIFVESGWTPIYLYTDGGSPFEDHIPGIGGGRLHAYDLATGAHRWYCELESRATFIVITGTRLYLGETNGTIHAFEDSETLVYGEANQCGSCGTDIGQYQNPKFCPNCGNPL